jgi:hypothetical protein
MRVIPGFFFAATTAGLFTATVARRAAADEPLSIVYPIYAQMPEAAQN